MCEIASRTNDDEKAIDVWSAPAFKNTAISDGLPYEMLESYTRYVVNMFFNVSNCQFMHNMTDSAVCTLQKRPADFQTCEL